MVIIACVDNNMGMKFNKRRVSRDAEVISDIETLLDGRILKMHPYSISLFENSECVPFQTPNYLMDAKLNDCFFLEENVNSHFYNSAEYIVFYKWNKSYPSDEKFIFPELNDNFELIDTFDFKGKSHEKITREIYKRRDAK